MCLVWTRSSLSLIFQFFILCYILDYWMLFASRVCVKFEVDSRENKTQQEIHKQKGGRTNIKSIINQSERDGTDERNASVLREETIILNGKRQTSAQHTIAEYLMYAHIGYVLTKSNAMQMACHDQWCIQFSALGFCCHAGTHSQRMNIVLFWMPKKWWVAYCCSYIVLTQMKEDTDSWAQWWVTFTIEYRTVKP